MSYDQQLADALRELADVRRELADERAAFARERRERGVYVEGLKADAERYRYLRAHFTQGVRWRLEWYLPRWGEGTSAEQLDATLDAALAKNPAQDDAHRVFPKSLALIEEAQAALGAVHEIVTAPTEQQVQEICDRLWDTDEGDPVLALGRKEIRRIYQIIETVQRLGVGTAEPKRGN